MEIRTTLFFVLFGLVLCNLEAQQENGAEIISSIAEELAGDLTDPDAVEAFADKLHDLTENPVNINSCDEEELSRLFFLTDFQIKALIDYINTSGRLVSVFEIGNIPGFNRHLSSMMIPFITLNPVSRRNPDSVRFRNSFMSNFSVVYPTADTNTPGPPWKILIRYRFSAGRISGGLSGEKDSGERIYDGNPPLPDFISGNLAYSGPGIFRRIIIGDFGARFGMGTGINTSLRTGLSLTQPGYLPGKDEIRPYTSNDENIFFRGIAAQLKVKRTGLAFFFSSNRIDANVDTIDNGKAIFITTFNQSGLHNTNSSLALKDAVAEYCYGADFSLNLNKADIGFLWTGSRFTIPVKHTGSDPADIYDFEGEENLTATAYYRAVISRMVFYGEASSNIDSRYAFVQGLTLRPSGRLAINILYRNYQPGYTSFHGKGIFSGSTGNNVKGIFGSFNFEAARNLFITAGCDIFQYKWLRYLCSAPSMGVEREIRIKYLPSDRFNLDVFYNYRLSSVNHEGTTGIEKQVEKTSRQLKTVIKYSPFENLSCVTRIDFKISGPGIEKGMLLLQDFNYRFRNFPLSLWFRYCIFKTGGWETRIYTYENDLYRSFNIPALSGEGNRAYLMIDWKVMKFADIRLKVAFTSQFQDYDIYAEKQEIKLQVRFWL